jgi:hypothetical protein
VLVAGHYSGICDHAQFDHHQPSRYLRTCQRESAGQMGVLLNPMHCSTLAGLADASSLSAPGRLQSCCCDLLRGAKLINAKAGKFALDGAAEISQRSIFCWYTFGQLDDIRGDIGGVECHGRPAVLKG